MNAIFTRKDSPVVNDCFVGMAKWPYAVVLDGAILTALAGSAPVGISLEIGGTLTGIGFTVPAYPASVPIYEITLGITIPANTEVRWRVTAAPDNPGASISQSAITLSATAKGDAIAPPMTVRWVNGQEVTTLYAYDPVAHTFNDVSNGLAASRAVIIDPSPFNVLQIAFLVPGPDAVEVMRVEAGKLIVQNLTLTGGSSPGSNSPALEFMIGSVIVATLLADGTLIAPSATQGTVVDDPTQFIFYSGASPVASFGALGVTAAEFDEPL